MPPKRMITDKLCSYGAAKRRVMPNVKHRSHKGLNNRAENSHLPFRKRERTRLVSGRSLIATCRADLLRRPKPLRPIPDQPLRSTNSNPSTPGHGRVGSREYTTCLKTAVSASSGHVSNYVTTPISR
jgi:putative transposase